MAAVRSNISGDVVNYTEGAKNNPSANTLLADSGAQGAGSYEARILAGADDAATILVQHRNATNDATTFTHTIYVGPNSGMYIFTFRLAAQERIRVLIGTNLTGDAAATIQLCAF